MTSEQLVFYALVLEGTNGGGGNREDMLRETNIFCCLWQDLVNVITPDLFILIMVHDSYTGKYMSIIYHILKGV